LGWPGTGEGHAQAVGIFLKSTHAQRLLLVDHRSVGGIRASLYNAVTMQAVEALVANMAAFEKSL